MKYIIAKWQHLSRLPKYAGTADDPKILKLNQIEKKCTETKCRPDELLR